MTTRSFHIDILLYTRSKEVTRTELEALVRSAMGVDSLEVAILNVDEVKSQKEGGK